MLKRRLVTCGIAVSGLALAATMMVFGVPGRLEYHAFAELYHQGTPTTGSTLHMAIDCDPSAAGTQNYCYWSFLSDYRFDVAVTVGNSSGASAVVAAFNFNVFTDGTVLQPVAGTDNDLNGNPDADETALGPGWTCAIPSVPPPQPDINPDPAVADSFLACSSPTGVIVPAGEAHTRLATVHYAVARWYFSPVQIRLYAAAAADDNAVTLIECDATGYPPVLAPGAPCFGATLAYLGPDPLPTPTPPPPPDADADGVPDAYDNCPNAANPGQENLNGNFINLHVYGKLFDDTTRVVSDELGDACANDIDGDGLSNHLEDESYLYCTATSNRFLDALNPDTDGDRVPDAVECFWPTDATNPYSFPPPVPPGDSDHDGLTDAKELASGTDPANPDTDGDRLLDGVEVLYYDSSPRIADTDGDGCSDGKEAASLNNDLTVNSTDQLMVAQTFSNAGSTKYVVDFDVNKDGRINSTDMLVQAKVYGPC